MNSPSSSDEKDIEVTVVSEPNSPETPNPNSKFRNISVLIAPSSPQNYTIANGGLKTPESSSKFREFQPFRTSSPPYSRPLDMSPASPKDKDVEKHVIASSIKLKDDVVKENSPKSGSGQTSGYTSFSISSILSRSEPRKTSSQGRPQSPPRAVLEAAALAAQHLHSTCPDAAMLSR